MCGIDKKISLIYSDDMLTKQDIKSISLLLQTQKEEILVEMEIKFSVHDKEILRGIAVYIQDNLIPLFDDHHHPPVAAAA